MIRAPVLLSFFMSLAPHPPFISSLLGFMLKTPLAGARLYEFKARPVYIVSARPYRATR